MTFKPIIATAAMLALPLLVGAATDNLVAYPDGYRHWTHVKSMVIHPEHGLADPFEGIHHVYANADALAGLKSGQYVAGATLVFDLLHQDSGDAAIQEGNRKFIGVMEYDEERFADTGGWGFEAFAGDSKTERVVKDGGASCFACHQAVEKDKYVFSKYRN
ncbi:MAG: cytochrome P460 family protein [Gammaproteobacteria bacterium]|nr:cytochrome P460 family protein [Gammaproteobacteria bacterium]MDH5619971.1 cytochrome P460 family protein [Gammaproteobacteria bacterium]